MSIFKCDRCGVLEEENERLWSFIRSLRNVTIQPASVPDVVEAARPAPKTDKPAPPNGSPTDEDFRRSPVRAFYKDLK